MKVLESRPRQPFQVFWAITIIGVSVFIFALIFYVSRTTLFEILSGLQSAFASEMNDPGVTFFTALWYWLPVIFLIGVGLYSWVQSHKRKGGFY